LGRSYASQNDPRVYFGLGDVRQIDELEIRWPSGKVEKLSKITLSQALLVDEEQGVKKNPGK
jgi:enediyne biosynthesis protein E4